MGWERAAAPQPKGKTAALFHSMHLRRHRASMVDIIIDRHDGRFALERAIMSAAILLYRPNHPRALAPEPQSGKRHRDRGVTTEIFSLQCIASTILAYGMPGSFCLDRFMHF